MKKSLVTLFSLLLLCSITVTPAFCAGGKVQGDNGVGTVDQGEIGSDTGNANGADAQGNQT
jgi:hypothetical protein